MRPSLRYKEKDSTEKQKRKRKEKGIERKDARLSGHYGEQLRGISKMAMAFGPPSCNFCHRI
jgi:hypothetical protein